MEQKHIAKIADELKIQPGQVISTAGLLKDGATIPFIARYRKEATGTLDEVAITAIRDRLFQLEELDKRRESILKSLKERELLTEELSQKILASETMATLEDIYLPFRPKRRTRSTIAKEKGLEPFAEILFEQREDIDPVAEAEKYIDYEKSVMTVDDVLTGGRDIIAEWINEDENARKRMRKLFSMIGTFRTKAIKGKEKEGAKYKDYFDLEEPVKYAPSHRILAMRRGEKEGYLDLRIMPPEDEAIAVLKALFLKKDNPCSQEVKIAIEDSYKRLLSLSLETEIRLETKNRADKKAIRVFADNLRELLLAPPLGQKNIMAIDPGIRTGCKIACLNSQGKLLQTATVYPFQSEFKRAEGAETVHELFNKYGTEAVAIGNGTAGRETFLFVKELNLSRDVEIVMVNESGASVYSASEVARKEFPELDVSFRGAISIGRRLMDPLAELVKIEPKSIGVGQYQHDVNQNALKQGLDDVVISCVNAVGVDVNTASEQLLTYVSGLGPQLAMNIITFRDDNGSFTRREELKKVPRLGPKAYEQAAGFLRIRNGKNPLDASAVHPESYSIVKKMAEDLSCNINELLNDNTLRMKIVPEKYVTDKVGIPTLKDILLELAKPGRDPRKSFESMVFKEGIEKLEDLEKGMKLPGIVTNVTAFGAFVDIGVHQDGLVHISQMANSFVKDPRDVVKVQQMVEVTVLDVDLARRRISLSMKEISGIKDRKQTQQKPEKHTKMKRMNKRYIKNGIEPFNNPFKNLLSK